MAEEKSEVNKTTLAPKWKGELRDQLPATYVENFITWLLVKAIRLGKELKITTGIEEAGKFGDVSIHTEESGRKLHQLINIRWEKNPKQRNIPIFSLTSKLSPYSLIGYFSAFRRMKTEFTRNGNEFSDLVICTNGRIIWHVKQNLFGIPLRIKDSFCGKRDGILSKKNGNLLGSTVVWFKNDSNIRELWARHLKENVEMDDDDLDDDIEMFLDKIRLTDCLPEVWELKEKIFQELSLLGVEAFRLSDAYSFLLEKVLHCGNRGQKYHLNSVDRSLMIDMFKKGEEVIEFGVEAPVKHFSGRSVELEQIILEYKNNNKSQMMITGIGGIGKTELVKKFAAEWKYAFQCIFFMNGDCMENLKDSFKDLAFQKLRIPVVEEDGKEKDFNTILQEINQLLKQRTCILILDNVIPKGKDSERSYLKKFISLLSFKPFLLMTSRHEPWDGFSTLPLKELSEEEAVEMVKESLPVEETKKKKAIPVTKLLKLLNYYPLALKLAISCMSESPESNSWYLNTFDRIYSNICTCKGKLPFQDDYMISTKVALEVIMEKLRDLRVDMAEKCLKIISFMNPDEICVLKVVCCFEEEAEEKVRTCLRTFHRYGIVNYTGEELKTYDVLQILVRHKVSKEDEVEVLEKILNAESMMSMNYEMFTWEYVCKHEELMIKYSHIPALILKNLNEEEKYEEGYEFGRKIVKKLSECLHDTDKNLIDAIKQLGDITYHYGEQSEALKFYRDALFKLITSQGEESTETMVMKEKVASLLFEMEKYDENPPIFQVTHECLEKNLPKADLKVLQSRCSMALNLAKQGKNEESARSLRGIYSCLKVIQEDVTSLEIKRQVAKIFLELRNFEESLSIYMDVYDGFKRVLGAKHLESLSTQRSIAMILGNLGEISESLEMYQTINALMKEVVGDEHPDTLSTGQSIVSLLNELGRYEESLSISKELYNTSMRVLGGKDPITLKTGQAVALSLRNLGKLEESLVKFKEIFPAMNQVLGGDDPSTVNTGSNIASLLFEMRKFKDSHDFYRKLYPVLKISLGETHPDVLNIGLNFVLTFIELGKYREGHEFCNEIFLCCKRILGIEHPDTLRSGCMVALFLQKLGRSKESLAVLEEQCDRMKNIFGDNHVETLNGRCSIASALNALGKHEESFIVYEEVCNSKKILFGDEHPEVFSVECKMAACLYEMGKYKESLFKYVELFLIMQKVLGEESMEVLNVKCSIAFTYRELGMYEPSLEMYKEVYFQIKRLLGEEDARTLRVRSDMTLIEEKLKYPGNCWSTHAEIYIIMKKVLSEDHPSTINAHGNVAHALVSLGKHEAGLDILYDMKERLGKVLGEEHYETLRVMSKIAQTLGEINKNEESMALFDEVCRMMRKSLGDEHKVSLNAKREMSHILRNSGRYEESLALSMEIYQVMKKVFGKEHPETLNIMNDVAVTLSNLSKFEESLNMYNEVYYGTKAVFGEENLFTIERKKKMDLIMQKVENT